MQGFVSFVLRVFNTFLEHSDGNADLAVVLNHYTACSTRARLDLKNHAKRLAIPELVDALRKQIHNLFKYAALDRWSFHTSSIVQLPAVGGAVVLFEVNAGLDDEQWQVNVSQMR